MLTFSPFYIYFFNVKFPLKTYLMLTVSWFLFRTFFNVFLNGFSILFLSCARFTFTYTNVLIYSWKAYIYMSYVILNYVQLQISVFSSKFNTCTYTKNKNKKIRFTCVFTYFIKYTIYCFPQSILQKYHFHFLTLLSKPYKIKLKCLVFLDLFLLLASINFTILFPYTILNFQWKT